MSELIIDNKLITRYSIEVAKGRLYALQYIDEHRSAIEDLWDGAYDMFLLNTKIRHLSYYYNERKTICDTLVEYASSGKQYTSYSAMISNFLLALNDHSGLNKADIVTLKTYLRAKPTRFSIDYFINSIAADMMAARMISDQDLEDFYITINDLFARAVNNMSKEEKSSIPSFFDGKEKKASNWIALKTYKRLEENYNGNRY